MFTIRSEKKFIAIEFKDGNCFGSCNYTAVINDVSVLFLKSNQRSIVVNMCNVTHIDSNGYGTLLMIAKKASKEKINIAYSNFTNHAVKALKLMQLDKVLKTFDREEDAIASFSKPPSNQA